MNAIKKTLFTMVVIVSVIALIGCSTGVDKPAAEPKNDVVQSDDVIQPDNETTADAKQDGWVIGFSNSSTAENSWRVQLEAEFKYRADQLKTEGVISEYYMTNANSDITKQISDVQDLITKKCDAILITPMSPDALVSVVDEAMAAGIVVVCFENQINTEISAQIEPNQTEYGRIIGEWMGKQLPDGGKVVVFDGTAGTTLNQLRHDAMMEAMFAESPNIEVIAQVNGDYNYATAKTLTEDILLAQPKIDGILSQSSYMTNAIYDAFIEANRELVPMTGEADNGWLRRWKEQIGNPNFASIGPGSPPYQSAIALDTAIECLNGKTFDEIVYVQVEPITEETIDDFYRADLPESYSPYCFLPDDIIKKLFEVEQ